MNHAEIMKSAHAAARAEMRKQSARAAHGYGYRPLYANYREAFASILQGMYASRRRAPRPAVGFQIVEPRRHDWQDRNCYSFGNYQS